jgi:hypothetical protein
MVRGLEMERKVKGEKFCTWYYWRVLLLPAQQSRSVATFHNAESLCLQVECYTIRKSFDRLCDLVVRVPGYITKMYCVSCEVRTEFIYVM